MSLGKNFKKKNIAIKTYFALRIQLETNAYDNKLKIKIKRGVCSILWV